MVIVAGLYAVIVWLVFFRLKWLRWGWLTGTVTVLVGVIGCVVFVGFLSYLAPTGRVVVVGHVVEVTPNVSGQITETNSEALPRHLRNPAGRLRESIIIRRLMRAPERTLKLADKFAPVSMPAPI
jgi:hypothetical protein